VVLVQFPLALDPIDLEVEPTIRATSHSTKAPELSNDQAQGRIRAG
jgi:hypothetical protein